MNSLSSLGVEGHDHWTSLGLCWQHWSWRLEVKRSRFECICKSKSEKHILSSHASESMQVNTSCPITWLLDGISWKLKKHLRAYKERVHLVAFANLHNPQWILLNAKRKKKVFFSWSKVPNLGNLWQNLHYFATAFWIYLIKLGRKKYQSTLRVNSWSVSVSQMVDEM